MNRRVAGVVFAIGNVLFAVSPIAVAQTVLDDRDHRSRDVHWLIRQAAESESEKAVTKPGGLVASYPCDPLMSAAQESRILVGLSQPTALDLAGGTPLNKFAQELSRYFPVRLDVRSLEEIGLGVDIPVVDQLISRLPTETNASQASTKKKNWWDAKGQREFDPRRPLLVSQVVNCLRSLDLTLMIRHGEVVITTAEAAEDDPAVRIYDVTPLIGMRTNLNGYGNQGYGYRTSSNAPFADFDSLTSLIETTVEPDTWEALGGNSTISASEIRGRYLLVISTTSINHWRVQRLLDRLNQ